jgi:hypothetical protein
VFDDACRLEPDRLVCSIAIECKPQCFVWLELIQRFVEDVFLPRFKAALQGGPVDANNPSDTNNSSIGKPFTDNVPKKSATKKKPYAAPAFQFEKVFETNALTCGKVISTQGSCKFILKNS